MPGFGKSGIDRIWSLRSICAPPPPACGFPLRHSGFSRSWKGLARRVPRYRKTMTSAASILASEEQGATIWRAGGQWVVVSAAELDRHLRSMKLPEGRHVTVD